MLYGFFFQAQKKPHDQKQTAFACGGTSCFVRSLYRGQEAIRPQGLRAPGMRPGKRMRDIQPHRTQTRQVAPETAAEHKRLCRRAVRMGVNMGCVSLQDENLGELLLYQVREPALPAVLSAPQGTMRPQGRQNDPYSLLCSRKGLRVKGGARLCRLFCPTSSRQGASISSARPQGAGGDRPGLRPTGPWILAH